jgi:hypothetical protein
MSYSEISRAIAFDRFISSEAGSDSEFAADILAMFELNYQTFVQIWTTAHEVRSLHPEIPPDVLENRIIMSFLSRSMMSLNEYTRQFLEAMWQKKIPYESADGWCNLLLGLHSVSVYDAFYGISHEESSESNLPEVKEGATTLEVIEVGSTISPDASSPEEARLDIEILDEAVESSIEVGALNLIKFIARNIIAHPEKTVQEVLSEFRANMHDPDFEYSFPKVVYEEEGEVVPASEVGYELSEVMLFAAALRYVVLFEADATQVLLFNETTDPTGQRVLDIHIQAVSNNPMVQTVQTLRSFERLMLNLPPSPPEKIRGVSHFVTPSMGHRIIRYLCRKCGYQESEFSFFPNLTFSHITDKDSSRVVAQEIHPWQLLTTMFASLSYSHTYIKNFLRTGNLPELGLITFPSDKLFAKSSYNTKTPNGE